MHVGKGRSVKRIHQYLLSITLPMEMQVGSNVLEELREELRSLNMAELSKVSGIAAWRLRELVQQGKGPPHFRVGITYRFPVVGVRKWFAEQTSSKKES